MQRDIKFRGLRVDNGNWVYGSFIHNSIDCPCIIDYDAEQYEIIPESVGQFTGLTDKNGTDIYEWDKFEDTWESGYLLVEWNDEESRFQLNVYDYPISYGEGGQEVYGSDIERVDENIIDMSCISAFEIIGNIHEEK